MNANDKGGVSRQWPFRVSTSQVSRLTVNVVGLGLAGRSLPKICAVWPDPEAESLVRRDLPGRAAVQSKTLGGYTIYVGWRLLSESGLRDHCAP